MVPSLPYLVGPAVILAAVAVGCSGRATTGTVGNPPSVPDSTPPPTVAAPPSAPAVAPGSDRTDDPRCDLIPAAENPVQSVGLTHPVDSRHAPRPTNDGERLLFRHLYETLVRLDCDGSVRPALAESWSQDDLGTLVLTLRENARFADDRPVAAKEIVAGWSRNEQPDALRPEVLRHIHEATAVNERTLAIVPRHGRGTTPALLAHPDLAIAKHVPGTSWPLGTRGRIISGDTESGDRGPRTISVAKTVDAGAGQEAELRFVLTPAGDPRDLLDAPVDLLVTDSPAAIEYAATLAAYEVMPLEPHRTYAFVSSARGLDAEPLTPGARDALAADAVRGAARGAQDPFWFDRLTTCEAPRIARDRTPRPIRSDRVVYELGDQTARDLAARLVALAGTRGPSAATSLLASLLPDAVRGTVRRATGLAGSALDVSQRRGEDPGYVIAVERQPIDPCAAFEQLASRMPWLDVPHLVPLVETRRDAIVRTGRDGVRLEFDTVVLGSVPGPGNGGR